MGLDMYLFPKKKDQTVKEVFEKFNYVGYWRKDYELNEFFISHGVPLGDDRYIIERKYLVQYLEQTLKEYIAPRYKEPETEDEEASWDYDESVQESIIFKFLDILHKNNADKFIYYASW